MQPDVTVQPEVAGRGGVRVLRPESPREAVTMARRFGGTYIAGASWLQPVWERRQSWPSCLVALDPGWPGFRGIDQDEGGLTIGALTTLDELASHPLVHDHLPGLGTLLDQVAGPGVRRLGTVGGNLCAGGDLSALFLALDARLHLVGHHDPKGESLVVWDSADPGVDLIQSVTLPDARPWRIAVDKLGHRERFSPTRATVACVHDGERVRLAVCGEGGPGRLSISEAALNDGHSLSGADRIQILDTELEFRGWQDPTLRLATQRMVDYMLAEVGHGV